MERKTIVTLLSAAKIGGKFYGAGASPEVSDRQLADLVAAGAVAPDAAGQVLEASTPEGADLAAAIARAETAEARVTELEASLTEAVVQIIPELQAAVIEAEAQRDLLQERVLDLQRGIETADDGAAAPQSADQQQGASDAPAGDAPAGKPATGKKVATKAAKS
ncbi:MAG TPA: hypothetical protein DEB47_04835 [Citreicella sp.]|nr:hypothetical protein [Citreicella sp.]